MLGGKTKALWETESSDLSRLLITLLKYVAFKLEGPKERSYWRDLDLNGRLMLR